MRIVQLVQHVLCTTVLCIGYCKVNHLGSPWNAVGYSLTSVFFLPCRDYAHSIQLIISTFFLSTKDVQRHKQGQMNTWYMNCMIYIMSIFYSAHNRNMYTFSDLMVHIWNRSMVYDFRHVGSPSHRYWLPIINHEENIARTSSWYIVICVMPLCVKMYYV